MSDAELRRNLRLHGLYGPEEQRNEEQREAEKSAEGRSARSVSVSDEPDSKKQKKEKAEAKKKEEEEKKRKEAEDLRSQLQSESDIILHGYLFDETFRCETQKSLMKQAKYERQLKLTHRVGKNTELSVKSSGMRRHEQNGN